MASPKGDFAGIGRDAVGEEDRVRFGGAVDGDNQLRIAGGMRSGIAKDTGPGSDLGHLQVVSVYKQTQAYFRRMRFLHRSPHG